LSRVVEGLEEGALLCGGRRTQVVLAAIRVAPVLLATCGGARREPLQRNLANLGRSDEGDQTWLQLCGLAESVGGHDL
jgi:hypothetical protein